ncbi:MAG TPA: VOC family protein [Pyrinomonadaceae bacterium]|nr:VOC family protein [Pyrinomonadaceae bacterium]
MKQVNTYLMFDGNCREAMQFYSQCLGARLDLMSFADAKAFAYPAEAKDRVIHAKLTKGTVFLMASDTMPGMPWQQGTNFSISIDCESAEEIERLFGALGEKGTVTMPLSDAFWGARFGMLKDRFGINWMFNWDKPNDA